MASGDGHENFPMGFANSSISLELFSKNRERLVESFRYRYAAPPGSVILLQGGNDDESLKRNSRNIFQQESNFLWAFGVVEPDCYGAICFESGITYLFVPRPSEDRIIFTGPNQSAEDYRIKYKIEFVYYVDEMLRVLKECVGGHGALFLLQGVNEGYDNYVKPAYFTGIEEFKVNNTLLLDYFCETRVYKTDLEEIVIRYAVDITAAAHKQIMQMIKPGLLEYHTESFFLDYCYRIGGCRTASYRGICASGANTAILNYGHVGAPNDRRMKDGDMCICDMGTKYFGYSTKVACSFPVNGKFTTDQRLIYEAVLAARKVIYQYGKPGTGWQIVHLKSAKRLLTELKKGGLLQGNVDDMAAVGLQYIFQPHGLGHLSGLDVCENVTNRQIECTKTVPPPSTYLKFNRVLKFRMYLTIEPACYFIKPLLNKARNNPLQSGFLVEENLSRFENFGGIRITDNVIVTEDGLQNLTNIPRTVEEIELWMSRN